MNPKKPPLPEYRVGSIQDYFTAIDAIRTNWASKQEWDLDLWFRGQSCRAHALLPGWLRPNRRFNPDDEVSMFDEFRTLAGPFVDVAPTDPWEWYFLAQHYGLPTRLLDWSESALTALFFAIEPDVLKNGRAALEVGVAAAPEKIVCDNTSPVVWVLEPGTLNEYSWGEHEIVLVGSSRTTHYLPWNIAGTSRPKRFRHRGCFISNKHPIAVLPNRANRRIIAQQGTFTVHGWAKNPLEALAGKIRLAAISVNTASIPLIWEQMRIAGISRPGLFPELPSLAQKLAWHYSERI